MGIFERLGARFADWRRSEAAHHALAFLPDPNAPDGTDHAPHDSYLRVWLTESFLVYDQKWGTERVPTVHGQSSLDFAGQAAQEFAAIAAPGDGAEAQGVHGNFPLTELLPYSGGVVHVEAGLVALRKEGSTQVALGLLQDLGKLVTPPVSTVVAVAGKVADGIGALIGNVDGVVSLGYTSSFASAGGGGENVLRPGYIAVIGGPASEFPDGSLEIVNSRLRRKGESGALTGYDYMLLRIERRKERDDWRFPSLLDLRKQALEAKARADHTTYQTLKGQIVLQCLTSLDLTPTDQVRAATALSEEFKLVETAGLGAAPSAPGELEAVIEAFAPSSSTVASNPRPSLAQLL